MWKPNLKGLTDKVKEAGSKTAGFGKGLGAKAKNLGKSSVGRVKKLNPFKKNKEYYYVGMAREVYWHRRQAFSFN